jgi:hypothetical protein
MSNVISLAEVRAARQAGAPKPTPSPPPVAAAPPPARKPAPPKSVAPAQLRWRQSARGNWWTEDPRGIHLVIFENRQGWAGRVTLPWGKAWFEDMPGVCSAAEARAWAEEWLEMHCVPSAAATQPAEQDTHWTYDHDLDQVAGSPWLQD